MIRLRRCSASPDGFGKKLLLPLHAQNIHGVQHIMQYTAKFGCHTLVALATQPDGTIVIAKGCEYMQQALICLDVQADFLGNTLDYIAPLCQRYLDEHGDEYQTIVLTKWVYEELNGRDTLLLSHAKAQVVAKTTYSGLTEETLVILRDHDIELIHLAGVDADLSVLATMFSCIDAGFRVQILERLVASYHGRNWEAMMIARNALGKENVLNIGGGQVYI